MKDFWTHKWDWLARKQRVFFLEAMKVRYTIFFTSAHDTTEVKLCQCDTLDTMDAILRALWRDDVQGPWQVRIERI